MTRTAYLDCFSGISGDMLLGALLDLGWPAERLNAVIAQLRIENVRADITHVTKQGIYATQVNIVSPREQPHRGYHDLADIVLNADLAPAVQDQALAALKLLAEVESTVHHVPFEE